MSTPQPGTTHRPRGQKLGGGLYLLKRFSFILFAPMPLGYSQRCCPVLPLLSKIPKELPSVPIWFSPPRSVLCVRLTSCPGPEPTARRGRWSPPGAAAFELCALVRDFNLLLKQSSEVVPT